MHRPARPPAFLVGQGSSTDVGQILQQCEARVAKNNRRCAMWGFGGLDERGGLSVTKTKGLLFLRLFLFRSFCLKRMKSGYRADALSRRKAFRRVQGKLQKS